MKTIDTSEIQPILKELVEASNALDGLRGILAASTANVCTDELVPVMAPINDKLLAALDSLEDLLKDVPEEPAARRDISGLSMDELERFMTDAALRAGLAPKEIERLRAEGQVAYEAGETTAIDNAEEETGNEPARAKSESAADAEPRDIVGECIAALTLAIVRERGRKSSTLPPGVTTIVMQDVEGLRNAERALDALLGILAPDNDQEGLYNLIQPHVIALREIYERIPYMQKGGEA